MNNKLSNVLRNIFLVIVCLFMIFPFYYLIVSITNASNEIATGKLLPGLNLITNLKNTFSNDLIMVGFKNSLIVSGITTVLSLLVNIMAAYGFEYLGNKYTDKLFKVFLVSMSIPFTALMIPLFKISVLLNLSNTLLALILPASVSVFIIFFVRQNLKSFPFEIIESARIDGASEFVIFFKIVTPIIKPIYATVTIMTFMNVWTSYLWPLIILQTENKFTLPLVLANISSDANLYPDYGVIMVATLLSAIPLIIIFFGLQKYFVNGISGSIK